MPGAALVWLGLAAVAQRVGASCSKSGARCQCTDTDGDIWDLTELSGDHQVSGPGSSIWTFEYHFNFCDNTAPPTASTCGFSATNAYRVEDYTGTSPVCLNLGSDHADDNIVAEKINGAAANGVRIRFSQANPTSGSFAVDLQCDGTQRGIATQPEPPAYQVEASTVWPTYYSCPAHQNSSDWGWPLLILLSVSGVLYVGAGYGYNYKMKDGELSHPHSHHWAVARKDGPGMVMDGIFFTRCQLADKLGMSFLEPSEEDRRRFDSAKRSLLSPGDGETSAEGRTKKDKRRKDKDKDKDKRRKSDHKSSKSSKKDRRDSKSKVAVLPDVEAPVREIKDVARVGERVMDIEIAEGNIKE